MSNDGSDIFHQTKNCSGWCRGIFSMIFFYDGNNFPTHKNSQGCIDYFFCIIILICDTEKTLKHV